MNRIIGPRYACLQFRNMAQCMPGVAAFRCGQLMPSIDAYSLASPRLPTSPFRSVHPSVSTRTISFPHDASFDSLLYASGRRIIDVGMFEMKRACAPNVLWSGGLGPCVGIAFYDPGLKVGYLIHAVHPSECHGHLAALAREITDRSRMQIVVCGNSLSSFDDEAEREAEASARTDIPDMLRGYFAPSQIVYLEWAPDEHVFDLFLDVQSGHFYLQREAETSAVRRFNEE